MTVVNSHCYIHRLGILYEISILSTHAYTHIYIHITHRFIFYILISIQYFICPCHGRHICIMHKKCGGVCSTVCLYTTSTYFRTMQLMLIVSIADHYICAHSYNILVFYCNIITITCRIVYLHLSHPPASICVHIYLSQAMCCAFEQWSEVTFSLFRFG